ncbi:MAG: potassium transporter [Pseudomonadales bacterium]|jgi:trk system potassium uptake protein|uniref:TrkH family potassium uptake protein n=1 Tax=unclassified Ketobacter TaxID=2639109 RepID=UPI000C3B8563|nr:MULTISPECIES: potassium transporter TrkG [unclassified Ketobacter]MAQ26720.1 potassium transporter [Pseudomonadales bacterium]MEC8810011.1 potassium transporter TrkG [Pseudomonadota bacterium]TNC88696.1 MAG: potassium transporter [Alcanivorax sp.]HAU15436.1 potassium transporter [Gammaproteobacteria bacterium]MBI28188.1 potassium transporter [Pseudomonadales bacterium]|tara:strand:- start:1070 stop:2527 length:1458 start_codon:yes stop_codon:yes gene_type:complete
MIRKSLTLYLLALPIGLMGAVDFLFGMLSVLVFEDHEEVEFFTPAVVFLAVAYLLVQLAGKEREFRRVGFRDAVLFAVSTWLVSGLFGAFPIIMVTKVSISDGVFESVSALTTTGATILTGLDDLPKSFLLYRQFLQWLGGLGVVIFVVAVLPMLNVGGTKLLKAETPGPVKDEKLSPRIAKTAHYLWVVYFVLTALCAVAYYVAGMSVFDAISHSLTTVSTGGFSTHDSSLGYFNSNAVLMVADIFMLLGAISFALHFKVWRSRQLKLYWRDEETRYFLLCIALITSMIWFGLRQQGGYSDSWVALNAGAFHLISFMTSTGFAADSFADWPLSVVFLLIFAGYLGGCAGSTAGGNKMIRNILSVKLFNLEIKRLIHSRGVFIVKFQGRPVTPSVLGASVVFMFVAAVSTMVLTLVMMASGLGFLSALTAVAACLNVLGPAFGELDSNFQPVSDFGTWVLTFTMILGRLEYFTVLSLLIPDFWRR